MGKLTGKQVAFANGVIAGLSPVEAYREAGYSQKMSKAAQSVQAQKLLNKPNIALMIEEAREEAAEAAKWSLETALERLKEVNRCSYLQIIQSTPEIRIQASVTNAFLGSLDRLNKLTGVDIEAERAHVSPDAPTFVEPI